MLLKGYTDRETGIQGSKGEGYKGAGYNIISNYLNHLKTSFL